MTDIMEDYQDNVRRMIRLMGCELGISNHVYPGSVNSDEWMNRVSQATTDMYSPETPSEERPREPENAPYSFNEMPPNRGIVYTQTITPVENPGIPEEQIANSTELVQYDASMNEPRCPIALDNFVVGQNILRIISCGHIFGETSLRQWFTNHNVCPVCRTVVGGTHYSLSDRFADVSGNSTASSNILTQIVSSLVNSLNGVSANSNQIYESEFEFNVNDLMDAYSQLNNSPASPQ
jgi:hypothetical protein